MTETIMTSKEDRLAILMAREAAFKSLLKSCNDSSDPRTKARELLTLLGVDGFVQGAFSANYDDRKQEFMAKYSVMLLTS